jgi:hypothetical protein
VVGCEVVGDAGGVAVGGRVCVVCCEEVGDVTGVVVVGGNRGERRGGWVTQAG